MLDTDRKNERVLELCYANRQVTCSYDQRCQGGALSNQVLLGLFRLAESCFARPLSEAKEQF